MSKIRVLSFDVAIFGLMVAGGLQATTITSYSGNINMNLSTSYTTSTTYNVNIVGSNSTSYSNYSTSTTVQNNNLCSYCGSSYTSFYMPVTTTYPTMNTNLQAPLAALPITMPTSVVQSSTVKPANIVTVPVVQPSNTSTVTTTIPTVHVGTNFALGPNDFADPEPSTVLLLVSGVAAIGILRRKQLKSGRTF
jgi:hypothetical protein